MTQYHVATLPNGQVVTRESENKTYSHICAAFDDGVRPWGGQRYVGWVCLGFASSAALALKNGDARRAWYTRVQAIPVQLVASRSEMLNFKPNHHQEDTTMANPNIRKRAGSKPAVAAAIAAVEDEDDNEIEATPPKGKVVKLRKNSGDPAPVAAKAAKPKKAAAERNATTGCRCGCGQTPKRPSSAFMPGHDHRTDPKTGRRYNQH